MITFAATRQSSTVATLQGWAIGTDATLEPVTGTVELQDGGRTLVIAPDSSPFNVGTLDCSFDRYTGTFTGVVSGQGLAPARRLAGMQLAGCARRQFGGSAPPLRRGSGQGWVASSVPS
jgi:hypothetical protein